MEADGIDLGSAKDDLNIMLTLKAVKAAFASSEQMFNNFDTQRLLETFISLDKGSDRTELSLHLVSVPPLSTSELPEDPILGSLQGSHFEPWRNGRNEDAFNGEIPNAFMVQDPEEDLISEINPTTKGEFELPPKSSEANEEHAELDENDREE